MISKKNIQDQWDFLVPKFLNNILAKTFGYMLTKYIHTKGISSHRIITKRLSGLKIRLYKDQKSINWIKKCQLN